MGFRFIFASFATILLSTSCVTNNDKVAKTGEYLYWDDVIQTHYADPDDWYWSVNPDVLRWCKAKNPKYTKTVYGVNGKHQCAKDNEDWGTFKSRLSTHENNIRSQMEANANKTQKLNIKNQCLEFGFKEGTEGFANCQLELTILANDSSSSQYDERLYESLEEISKDVKRNKLNLDKQRFDEMLRQSKEYSLGNCMYLWDC